MMTAATTDVWASGEAYEPYIGRWSRLVAQQFLTWLAMPAGAEWLDVGCGTGALTEAILRRTSPSRVQSVDASPAYVRYAERRVADPRATFAVADATRLPRPSLSVDAVVSALVLNFISRPDEALAEMARVARPGGRVAAYVWDYGDQMQLIRYFWDAATALDPAAAELDEARRFPLCRPAALEELFQDAGLDGVECRAIDVPTRFRDFHDYWSPFLGGQGPAPGYAIKLDESRRVALRERIRNALPIAPDGSLELVARAWAVRGVKR